MSEQQIAALVASDPSRLVECFDARESERDRRAMLGLWLAAMDDADSPEVRRALAFLVAQRTVEPVADAVLAWLLCQAETDPSTLVNVLTAVEVRLAERQHLFAQELWSPVARYVCRTLASPTAMVRDSSVSVIETAASIDPTLGWFGADAIAAWRECLRDCADRQLVELATVALGGDIALVPRVRSARTGALNGAFLRALDDLHVDDSAVDPALKFLRLFTLTQDARLRAAACGRWLFTIRVAADQARADMFRAVLDLLRCIAAGWREDDGGADFEMELMVAHAASVPLHVDLGPLRDGGPEAIRADFEVVSSAGESAVELAQKLSTLDGTKSAAAVTFLAALRREQAEVEIWPVSPSLASDLRSVTVRSGRGGNGAWASAFASARDDATERRGPLAKELIPQANSVARLYRTVEAVVANGVVTDGDIETGARQVNYYLQAARVLQLLDGDNLPTMRARALVALSGSARACAMAIYFEESEVARAWRRWAGKVSLVDVDPSTATRFLQESVEGLSGTTLPRRASTLDKWWHELMPFHPARTLAKP